MHDAHLSFLLRLVALRHVVLHLRLGRSLDSQAVGILDLAIEFARYPQTQDVDPVVHPGQLYRLELDHGEERDRAYVGNAALSRP